MPTKKQRKLAIPKELAGNSTPEVRQVEVSGLIPYTNNARTHSAAQVAEIAASIKHCGWTIPILIDENGGVLAGHGRLEAAKSLAMEKVPAIVAAGWTETQKKAYILADNKLAENAGWDEALLRTELSDLRTMEFDLDLAGFGEKDLIDIFGAEDLEAPEPQLDKAAALQKKWKTKRGQIWQIGEHRLMCGDCTDPEDVDSLAAGATIDAVLTDPPYGTEQLGVPGDDPETQRELYDGCLDALPTRDAVIIAFQSPRLFHVWFDAAREHGARFERMLWMYKPPQMGYPWRGWIMLSEAILIFSIGKPTWIETKPFAHDCYTVNIIGKEINYGGSEKEHGPMWHGSIKPLAVVRDIASRIGKTIYEPFAGSATTFIAAEQTGRTCYGMEIEPKYVAVSLERMADMGLKPKLAT